MPKTMKGQAVWPKAWIPVKVENSKMSEEEVEVVEDLYSKMGQSPTTGNLKNRHLRHQLKPLMLVQAADGGPVVPQIPADFVIVARPASPEP